MKHNCPLGSSLIQLYNICSQTKGPVMRTSTIKRDTAETAVTVEIDLDGTGFFDNETGVGFFDHMLDQLSRHALIDMKIRAKGDLHIDDHHTVEDVGISLGEAFNNALGDKKGIFRFGSAYAPLDEALSRVVVDFSGRPGLSWNVNFTKESINDFDLSLLKEFFHGFVNKALATVHIDNLKGENAHHQAETIFKAFALALKTACMVDPSKGDVLPSTKGLL